MEVARFRGVPLIVNSFRKERPDDSTLRGFVPAVLGNEFQNLNLKGVFFGGAVNKMEITTFGRADGAFLSLGFNLTEDHDIKGLTVAGLANITSHENSGVGVSLGLNSSGSMRGLYVASVNRARHATKGVFIAAANWFGTKNFIISGGNRVFSGVSIGIINYARISGTFALQIGVSNVIRENKGAAVQIGLVNICENTFSPIINITGMSRLWNEFHANLSEAARHARRSGS